MEEIKANSPVLEEPKKENVEKNWGLMKLTLKELEVLEINLKDVFTMEDVSINLSWTKVIRLTNYNASKKMGMKKTVLTWQHTFEEAMQILPIFLL